MSDEIITWEQVGELVRSHKLGKQAIKNRNEVAQLVRIQLQEVHPEPPTNTDIGVLLIIMGESLLEAVDND